MSAEPIAAPRRVTLADDHPPTRAGVRRSLETAGWIVCSESADARAAYDAAVEHRPDVVLLDIHMPGGGGVAAAEKISRALPDAAVVMLTVSRNDADLFDALRAGATGYLLKDTPRDDLVEAVRAAARGETVLAPAVARRLVSQLRSGGERLTTRELEVLAGVARGGSNAQIGAELFIAEATVKTHLLRIFAKLGVDDRTRAVTVALERGILRSP